MTEEEAKTKWCPFVRYDNGGSNRWKQYPADGQAHALNPIPCRCIGSACMAWRLLPKRYVGVRGLSSFGDEKPENPTVDDFNRWETAARAAGYVPHPDTDRYHGVPVAWAKPDDTAYGFCGLAGKP